MRIPHTKALDAATSHRKFRLYIPVIIFLLGGLPSLLRGQTLAPDDLIRLLDIAPEKVDTFMRQKAFLLLHRESDSVSSTRYYSSIDRQTEKPTWVRSLSYTEASVAGQQGKMINYRTYDRGEYDQMLVWLLQHDYQTVKQFQFDRDKHAVYSNGKLSIRLKVGVAELPDKRKTWVYEWESGL